MASGVEILDSIIYISLALLSPSLSSTSPNTAPKAVGLGILHKSSKENGSDGIGGNLREK